MITTLTGSNQFALREELNKILHEHRSTNGEMSVDRFDGNDTDLDKFSEAIMAVPFLADQKLVVISAIATQKPQHEKIIDILSDVPDSTHVVVYDHELDKRTSLYKFLLKESTMLDMQEPDERSATKWVTEYAKMHAIDIANAEAALLVDRVGLNQWQLHHEILKLGDHQKPITKSLIHEVVALNPRDTIFEMLDLTMQGKRREATEVYRRLLAMKTDPHYVLSMIAWQLHILAILVFGDTMSVDQIAKEAKMSPYMLKKSKRSAQRLDRAQLKQIVSLSAQADTTLKTTSANSALVIEQLLGRITTSLQ